MARCNCSGARCSCVIKAGANISITGNGSSERPLVISADAGGGSGSAQWDPGDLKWSARATVPAGWLLADGSSVSRTTYPALFAAIGTVYGPGDGVSTFNLPDYTGRFLMGSDNGHPRGSVGGAAQFQLDIDNIPRHTHAIDHNHDVFDSGTAGGHNHAAEATTASGNHAHQLRFSDDPGNSTQRVPKGTGSGGDTSAAAVVDNGGHTHNVNLDPVDGHTHNVNVPLFEGASGFAGKLDNDPIPLLPPYATAMPLIKT